MPAHHWWSWGLGLPVSIYVNSRWAPSSTSSIATDNQTNLNSPDPSTNAPGETHNLGIVSVNYIDTPAFENGSMNTGWFISRFNANSRGLNASSSTRIVEFLNGVTVVVRLIASSNGVTSTLNLYVNGTLVGTSTGAYGDSDNVIAIDFDLTQTPPEAGLVVDGTREIALGGGGGSPTTIDRIRFGSGQFGGSFYSFWGDWVMFDDIADLSDSETQNVWLTTIRVDGVTDSDASWTASSVSKTADVSDGDADTYVSTTSDPDTIEYTFDDPDTHVANWAPQIIYGVAAVAYGKADVLTDTTITLTDSGGTAASTNDTLNSVGRFVGAWAPDTSGAAAWDFFELGQAGVTYVIT